MNDKLLSSSARQQTFRVKALFALLIFVTISGAAKAQVDYNESGYPWNQTTTVGPDAAVPGWFYNLGITGLRVQLDPNAPRTLVVKYVFPGTPAAGLIQIDDVITGVEGQAFTEDHQDGYGPDVFGAQGPISEFGFALDDIQSVDGLLEVSFERGGTPQSAQLDVGTVYGSYSATYPANCPKSDLILAELLTYFRNTQLTDGTWQGQGGHENSIFAGLALLADGSAASMTAAANLATYYHNQTNDPIPQHGLHHWKYLAAAIYLSEYYEKTSEAWVLTKLETLYAYLIDSQYRDISQLVLPQTHDVDATVNGFGGWGHNPGFEGYGPICMTTGQGALALALMDRVGVTVDRSRLDAAYDFLVKGTGSNGYVWYADTDGSGGNPDAWADTGRTGASAIAHWMSPYPHPAYRGQALNHARFMGSHPQSFPDTHGSPTIGMAYAAMGTHIDPASFQNLMNDNRWWFSLSQCADGTFYYQPNRDNAIYNADPRFVASSVTALILSLPKQNLMISEQVVDPTWIPGDLTISTLDEETDIVKSVGTLVSAANFGEAAVTVNGLLHGAGSAAGSGFTDNFDSEGDTRNGMSGLPGDSALDQLLSGVAVKDGIEMAIGGLTTGQEYLFQAYWEGETGQSLTITMESGAVTTMNGVADQSPAVLISYRFVAGVDTLRIFIDRDDDLAGDTSHWLSGYSLQTALPVVNPSFEEDAFSTSPGHIADAGNGTITGWTASDPSRAGLNPANGTSSYANNGAVPNRSQVAFLRSDASAPVTLSSDQGLINLESGKSYALCFQVNAQAGSAIPEVAIQVNGDTTSLRVAPVAVAGDLTVPYRLVAIPFTATATTATLAVTCSSSSEAVLLLDNFTISRKTEDTWSVLPWSDDNSSGIETNNLVSAYNFGSASDATINGVTVTGISGTDPAVTDVFSSTGLNQVGSDTNALTSGQGGSATMAATFLSDSAPGSLTFQNLTPGHLYNLSLFSVGSGSTPCTATFESGLDKRSVDAHHFGQDAGLRLDYAFTADSSSRTLTWSSTDPDQPFPIYGFALNGVFLVQNNADSGEHSLREVLTRAEGAVVTFHPDLNGETIALESQLTISSSLTVDASDLQQGLTLDGQSNGFGVLKITGAPTVHLIGLNFINGEAIGTWPQTAGGAIFNSSGTLTIEACTLANNTAGTGGAIRNQGTMIIERSTVANNSSSGDSGGIFTQGPLTLKQVTLTDNTAGFAGGIWRLGDDPLTLENTILTGASSVVHSSSEIAVVTNGVNFFSSLQDSKLTEGPSVLVGADPMLASLGDHGGPTLTRPPLPNSPLIDAGGSSPHATDQRGFPRPIGQRADIGSVEWGSANTFSTWALEMLGDATASFTGDSDGDTDANGFEFGVGADGSKSDANSNRKPLLSTNPSGGFDITFGYRPGATGLCYILERSHAVGGYSEIYRFENESHTFISGEVMVASDANDPTKLTVTDKLPMEPRSFYRLRIVKE